MNVLLLGARASGKTTLGRELAQRLGATFVDLDDRVLAQFDQSTVSDVWRAHGEAAWRAEEARQLERVLAGRDQVIALGGGTPMIPDAADAIDSAVRNGAARSIYLRCPAETLAARLRDVPGDRPTLTGSDPADEISTVLALREPTYLRLSQHVVEVDTNDVRVAVERLIQALRS